MAEVDLCGSRMTGRASRPLYSGLAFALLIIGSAACGSGTAGSSAPVGPDPGPIDIGVHDPVMIRQDGTYYLFTTGMGIAVWSSPDMVTWQREPQVFESAPEWATDVAPNFRNHIWAPDIFHYNGTYYLYYSVSAFGRNTSAIGVTTNRTLHREDPEFRWVDHGIVVESVPGRDMFNAIDPNIVLDGEGTAWMSFGSFWHGIKLVKLDSTLTQVAQPEEWYTIASRHRYWKLDDTAAGDTLNSSIEAPFIFEKDGYYYLFASWDRCCAREQSTYKLVVGRSRDVRGPYRDKAGQDMRFGGGTVVVAGNEDWPGVGHNSAYTFDGRDYLVFHGYDMSDNGRSKLWIREIRWDSHGWPYVTLD